MRPRRTALARKLVASLLIGVACVWLTDAAIQASPQLTRLEADLAQGLREEALPLSPSPEIVLIQLTDDCAKQLPKRDDGNLSRLIYAELVPRFDQSRTLTVGFDINFSTPVPAQDALFRKALAEAKSTTFSFATEPVNYEDYDRGVPTFESLDNILPGNPRSRAASIVMFDVGQMTGGCILVEPESKVPSLSMSMFAYSLGVTDAPKMGGFSVRVGGREFQVTEEGAGFIQWTAKSDPFPRYRLSDVVKMSDEEFRKSFEGKLVIVGDVRESSNDVASTPFGQQPGMVSHAHLLNTLLAPSNRRILQLPPFQESALLSVFATLAAAICLRRRSKSTLLWALGLGVTALVLPHLLVRSVSILIDPVSIGVGPILGAFVALGVRPLLERSSKMSTSNYWGTSLFLDIRDSTPFLQAHGPEAYGALFEKIVSTMGELAKEHAGSLERPIGDAVLLIFREVESENHAKNAYEVATKGYALVRSLGVKVGMGIESGEMRGRFVQDADGETWSSFGDAINLSQRLQELTKTLPSDIAIGPEARKLLSESAMLVSTGSHAIRGFDKSYEVWVPAENTNG